MKDFAMKEIESSGIFDSQPFAGGDCGGALRLCRGGVKMYGEAGLRYQPG